MKNNKPKKIEEITFSHEIRGGGIVISGADKINNYIDENLAELGKKPTKVSLQEIIKLVESMKEESRFEADFVKTLSDAQELGESEGRRKFADTLLTKLKEI